MEAARPRRERDLFLDPHSVGLCRYRGVNGTYLDDRAGRSSPGPAGGGLYQRRQIARLGARLVEATRVDTLTGLLNRRAFEEMLDEELERSLRTGRPLSVIVGDLDWLGS